MLIAQLENQADVIGQIYAAEELGKLKQNKATEALGKALRSDPFWGVRVEASSALQGTQTDQSLEVLAANLQQTDARVRLQIVRDFGQFYNQRGRDLLFEVLKKEHNPAIVSAAIRGLGSRHDEQSAQKVREFLRSQSFRNQLVRAAVDAINQIGSDEFIPDLIALLKTRERELESWDVGFALQTLGKISRERKESPVVRDLLLSYVSSPKETIRISAMLALGQLGDDGVRESLEAIADNDRLDRAASAARSALDMLDEQSRSSTTSLSQLREQLRKVKEEHAELKEKVKLLQSRWNEQEQQEAEKS
jgi:aminopeptidase N